MRNDITRRLEAIERRLDRIPQREARIPGARPFGRLFPLFVIFGTWSEEEEPTLDPPPEDEEEEEEEEEEGSGAENPASFRVYKPDWMTPEEGAGFVAVYAFSTGALGEQTHHYIMVSYECSEEEEEE